MWISQRCFAISELSLLFNGFRCIEEDIAVGETTMFDLPLSHIKDVLWP